ncbi:unnamed protein product [Protopolystoma xenopodis]|uniref:Uncharacterized protein n=1 Tax=Protopolystoma xenopodis TaxID=117903 RepID=A0A3S5AC38_9PLAT|nr:unnamed protein product [Protopolystoma xenopodis]
MELLKRISSLFGVQQERLYEIDKLYDLEKALAQESSGAPVDVSERRIVKLLVVPKLGRIQNGIGFAGCYLAFRSGKLTDARDDTDLEGQYHKSTIATLQNDCDVVSF